MRGDDTGNAGDAATDLLFQRIRLWDAHIHSFTALNDATPAALANGGETGRLSGLSVGVKDIIDVKGLPTRNGSLVCQDAEPAAKDAAVVGALRAAGAFIAGKTTTTEFAFTDPTDCRNPHDLARSPGGSSSGSGAAVAAGLVDLALGTQTAGSLCRPAAYCGVVGFKPTYGSLSTEGVTPLAPSFDTVGVIARSVGLARRGFAALSSTAKKASLAAPTIAAYLPTAGVAPSSGMLAAFQGASQKLEQAGFFVSAMEPRMDAESIVSAHRIVMNHEAAAAHGPILSSDRAALLKPKFRAGLQAGVAVSPSQAEDAAAALTAAKEALWASLSGIDVVLTLPVPDGAPLIDGTTGYQDWLTPWTVFGGPLICLPWGLDDLGRPRSVMLAGRPGQDWALLDAAVRLEKYAPPSLQPKLPTG